MVWLFDRGNEKLHVETYFDANSLEFVVTLRFPTGLRETERFGTFERCRARLMALERQLETERWTNSGPPLFATSAVRGQRSEDRSQKPGWVPFSRPKKDSADR